DLPSNDLGVSRVPPRETPEKGHGSNRVPSPRNRARPLMRPRFRLPGAAAAPLAAAAPPSVHQLPRGRRSRGRYFSPRFGRVQRSVFLFVAVLASSFAVPSAAGAFQPAPRPQPYWRLTSETPSSDIAAGGTGMLLLQVENVGDAPSAAGVPITVVDHLPAGLLATQAGALNIQSLVIAPPGSGLVSELWSPCLIGEAGRTVTCTYGPGATIAPTSVSPRGASGTEGVEGFHSLAPTIGIEVSVEPVA